jgi:hypothetical protein
MPDSRKWVYAILGITLLIVVFTSAYFLVTQPQIRISEGTALSIINGVATTALAVVAAVNMMESKKIRGETVRPHLSLEPSFFEYDKDGLIRGFSSLHLVNGGTVARDVEIDVSIRNRQSLFYTSSIGLSERVQIWSGQPDELGGEIIVAIRYKNMFNKSLQEVLSINIDALNSAKRKLLPLQKQSGT